MSWRTVLFSAKGRMGRRDFWSVTLLLGIATIPLRLIGPLGDLFGLAFMFPHTCLFAKRLHDLGKTGWLAAVMYGPVTLVAFAAGVMTADGGDPPLALSAILGVVVIASLIFYFRIGLKKGDPAANVYGAPHQSHARKKGLEAEAIESTFS